MITNGDVTTPTKGAHDNHVTIGKAPEEEEDEGEILSDEEEMEQDKGNKNEETMEIKYVKTLLCTLYVFMLTRCLHVCVHLGGGVCCLHCCIITQEQLSSLRLS